MESSNWAPAHSDALRKYFAMGMSYAEIARAINAEFKTHYSRCAAIGRARRLELGFTRLLDQLALPAPKAPSSNLHKMVKDQEAAGQLAGAARPSQGNAEAALRRGRAARSVAARARSRRLPLSLWRRRRGRGDQLLRAPEAQGFKLLRRAFSPDAKSRRRAGTRSRHRGAAGRREPINVAVRGDIRFHSFKGVIEDGKGKTQETI